MSVMFINSFPRSGSTLLGNLLGLHKEIKYLGEVRNAVPPHGDSIFDLYQFRESEFWSKVTRSLGGVSSGLSTKTGDGTTEEKCFQNIRYIYSSCLENAHQKWIVDSSHRTREVKSHMENIECELKVIYLARDCRAVLNSVLKRKEYRNVVMETFVFFFQKLRFDVGAKLLRKKIGMKNVFVVRYEDLCAEPRMVLNKIAEFMGIGEFSNENFDEASDGVYIGGSSTFSGVSEKLSNIKEDLSWKKDLPLFPKILGWIYRMFIFS